MLPDASLLTLDQLFLPLASFLLVLGGIELWRLKQTGVLKIGALLAAVTSIIAALTIENPALQAGLLLVTSIIILIGWLDEQFKLSALQQLLWQLVIATLVVSFGWTIPHVTNPLGGGVVLLSTSSLFSLGNLLAIAWLVFLINALNWFDGSDGLFGSVAGAALLALAGISLLPATQDQLTLSLSLLGLGSIVAFLLWNWPPAKVYLGTTGSWFFGLFIGITAIIGGGKIATTSLVLALPLIDFFLVAFHRLLSRTAPWQADTERHWHHRLRNSGLTPAQIAALAGGVSVLFAIAAITLQTQAKLWLLAVIAIILSITAASLLTSRAQSKVKS